MSGRRGGRDAWALYEVSMAVKGGDGGRGAGKREKVCLSRVRVFPSHHDIGCLAMPPATVFWPLDIGEAGFCYGWTAPCICVIGSLPVSTVRALPCHRLPTDLHSL